MWGSNRFTGVIHVAEDDLFLFFWLENTTPIIQDWSRKFLIIWSFYCSSRP